MHLLTSGMLRFPLKSGHFAKSRQCPLYPRKRTSANVIGMSAKCQYAKSTLEFLQQVEVVATGILETDHSGAPRLVFWRTAERYACGP